MRVSKTHRRLLSSLLAGVLLSATITFVSFASSSLTEDVPADDTYGVDLDMLQRAGSLTVTGGVKVNGNPAKTGQTIVSNSKIVTDSGGVALVELGLLGRIKVGESTTVTFVFTREWVRVKSECNRTKIDVASGQVEVLLPSSETLGPGETRKLRGSVEAISRSAGFEIRCVGKWLALRPTRKSILGAALSLVDREAIGGGTPPVLSVLNP